jgi:hypothetical protein
MTLTAEKRSARREHYALKDARTRVYRVLYGSPVRHDPKGEPALNETRKLDQDWTYNHAEQVFGALATRVVESRSVSNGLFPDARYALLVRRLETLRKAKH